MTKTEVEDIIREVLSEADTLGLAIDCISQSMGRVLMLDPQEDREEILEAKQMFSEVLEDSSLTVEGEIAVAIMKILLRDLDQPGEIRV